MVHTTFTATASTTCSAGRVQLSELLPAEAFFSGLESDLEPPDEEPDDEDESEDPDDPDEEPESEEPDEDESEPEPESELEDLASAAACLALFAERVP